MARRMTAKQIKHFGTKAQKAALKRKRSGGRTTARKKTTRRRRRKTGKIAIAELAGGLMTAKGLWDRFQYVSNQTYVGKPKYNLGEAILATVTGAYFKNLPDGTKDWRFEPQAMFENMKPIYAPGAIGWGVSKFVGGRGWKGSGGLNLNQRLISKIPIIGALVKL